MMPPGLYRDRTFSATNAMTFLVYAALGAMSFFLVLQLQTVAGYNALEAGPRDPADHGLHAPPRRKGGELGTRIGPRIPMTVGPLVMAVGTVLVLGVDADVDYWLDVFPGVTVFGLGLALMVAPADRHRAGGRTRRQGRHRERDQQRDRARRLADGRRRAPDRRRAVGPSTPTRSLFDAAYGSAMIACAALLALGGVVSWLTIPARMPG